MSVRFEDSFWGEGDQGFTVLLARMKQGKYTSKEIMEVVATRAAIEEDYSKRLSKLAKVITAKDEVGTMRDALDAMRNGLEATAQSHLSLANEIRTQIEKPLTELLKEQTNDRKNQEKIVDKAQKTKNAQVTLVGKTKKNYETKVKEADEAVSAAQRSAGNPKEAEKAVAKSKKCSAAAENSDLEYKNSVEKLHEICDQWVTIHRSAFQVFQKMEEDRVENLKNFMWTLMNLQSTTWVSDDEGYRGVHEVIKKINGQHDMKLFVDERATGKDLPAVLTYEPIVRSSPGFSAGGSSLSLNTQTISRDDEPRKGSVTPQGSFNIPSPVITSTQPAIVSGKGLFNVRVLYDYDPQGDEELSLTEGEIIPVISTEEDPWWEGEKNGRTGMFPSNFVAKV